MTVRLEKNTDIARAYRFYLSVPGGNVNVVTDIIERADGTVWISSPLGGFNQSRMTYDETVACVTAIESANGSLKKSGEIQNHRFASVV